MLPLLPSQMEAGGRRKGGGGAVAFLPLMRISALYFFFSTGEPCIGGGGGGELDRKRLEDVLPIVRICLRPFPFPLHWLFQQASQPFSAAAARFVK